MTDMASRLIAADTADACSACCHTRESVIQQRKGVFGIVMQKHDGVAIDRRLHDIQCCQNGRKIFCQGFDSLDLSVNLEKMGDIEKADDGDEEYLRDGDWTEN